MWPQNLRHYVWTALGQVIFINLIYNETLTFFNLFASKWQFFLKNGKKMVKDNSKT